MVLLEIGRWRTLNNLIHPIRELLPKERVEVLVKECRDNMGYSMGAYYRDAVIACLTRDFKANQGGDERWTEFELEVVARLGKCQA
jgi:hypothetical protein